MKTELPVVAEKVGEQILWVPACFDPHYRGFLARNAVRCLQEDFRRFRINGSAYHLLPYRREGEEYDDYVIYEASINSSDSEAGKLAFY